jgi:saccharopine dehydrogenase-like NADP-dependent oxidoreductase
MHTVLVLGAGKIGALISGLLAESGAYRVNLADLDANTATGVARAHELAQGLAAIQPLGLDVSDTAALRAQLSTHPVQAVVSSLPYHCNPVVAAMAREAGVCVPWRRTHPPPSYRNAGWPRASSASRAGS